MEKSEENIMEDNELRLRVAAKIVFAYMIEENLFDLGDAEVQNQLTHLIELLKLKKNPLDPHELGNAQNRV